MSKIVRAAVLAAGIWLLVPAHASPVTLTFDGIVPGSAAGSVLLGSTDFPLNYYQSDYDLVLGGTASAARVSSDSPHDQRLVTSVQTFAFSIAQSPSKYDGFDTVKLDYWYTGTLDIVAKDASGKQVGSLHTVCNDTSCGWLNDQEIALDKDSIAGSLTFTASGTLRIDNLRLDMHPLQGPSVPEPASIALVALALTGAGVASRRRKA